MEATYEALRKHGYADLTIQAIADEFAKSKSLLYYHYDSKDGLLVDFLGYAIDGFAVREPVDPAIPPDDRLDALFDDFLAESLDGDRREFFVAIFELRSQAPSHVAYRDQFGRADRLITASITEILCAGIERGLFYDVDTDRTAELLYSMLTGGLLRRLTTSEPRSVPTTRRAIDRFVRSELLSDRDN
jgi:AcrR family transcriptional regulator